MRGLFQSRAPDAILRSSAGPVVLPPMDSVQLKVLRRSPFNRKLDAHQATLAATQRFIPLQTSGG
jgi:hypothetical protein